MQLLSLIMGPDSSKDLLSFFVDDETATNVVDAWRAGHSTEFNYYAVQNNTPTGTVGFVVLDTENVIGVIYHEVNINNEG